MNRQEYIDFMCLFNEYAGEYLIITFPNGLKVKCNAFHGMAESDTEPGDEDYIGEYYTLVNEVEIITKGGDGTVEICNNGMEISLKCLPEKIELEDGTLLWQRPDAVCQPGG